MPVDGGMPVYKYVSNRLLTLAQNLMMGTKLSEFHTRALTLDRDESYYERAAC